MSRAKRLIAVLGIIAAILAAVPGCAKKPTREDNLKQNNVVTDPAPSVSDELSFDLQQPEEPTFEETENLDSISDSIGPMYIERDGYAYQLDPVTMTPIEQPLDPVTYEPVTLESTEEDEGSEVVDNSASAEEPTEDTKYPNTGIFEEDD